MAEPPHEQTRLMRKSFACDECKRRKIRCSGGDRCLNCTRDAKECRYTSPSQRLVSLQRRLRESEAIRWDMERAWKIHLPDIDLQTALRNLPKTTVDDTKDTPPHPTGQHVPVFRQKAEASTDEDDRVDQQPSTSTPIEPTNAEDYEFDESLDVEGSIDGMAFLTADPHKAGYTGPQSGIAALKFLQSLPPYLPINNASPLTAPDDHELADMAPPPPRPADINRYIDEYFSLYHPAYPILHEGTFRARVSGALAKPRDGSWPLLYNSVIAIGAFVSGSHSTKTDYPFFQEARRHLSMDILEKGSLGYVQALTLLANYLQKRNKPNAGFILIGIAFSMALAIGLHREFDTPITSPFTMETRRRVWWTLFVFVSGAQLALGRPPASLVGVNVQLPANLDDADLAVDMDQIPPDRSDPTVSSCLIAQVKLAKIANTVHNELLTHRRPSYAKATKLEESIRGWWADLPPYFSLSVVTTTPTSHHHHHHQRGGGGARSNSISSLPSPSTSSPPTERQHPPLPAPPPPPPPPSSQQQQPTTTTTIQLDPHLILPTRVLLWRSFNLRIVLNRPFLFENIAAGLPLDVNLSPIASCLAAADECVKSICSFVSGIGTARRGFAWYATTWLIAASFVLATCLIYGPGHALAAGWRASLDEAVGCLGILGGGLDIALRARDILLNVLENRGFPLNSSPAGTMNPISTTLSRLGVSMPENHPAMVGMSHSNNNNNGGGGGGTPQSQQQTGGGGDQHMSSSLWSDDGFTWLSDGMGNNAEFLGAAGGLTYGNVFDVS